jgi:HEAT repeat protein
MNNNGKHKSSSPKERVDLLEKQIEQVDARVDNSPVFIQFLDDADPEVRATAISGLWHFPSPDLMDRLIEMATHDPSPMVRQRAVSALGIYMYLGEMADYDYDFGPMSDLLREDELPEQDFIRAKRFLADLYVDDTRPLDERRFAIEALGFLSDPAIVDLVEEAYNRPERKMKVSALFAMGRSGLVRWTEILEQELYSEDEDIQREAIRAVGEIGLDEFGQDLLKLTYLENKDLRLEAVIALGQTGWEGAFERLEELSDDADPEVAEVAADALEEWLFMDEMQRKFGDEELDLDQDDEALDDLT